MEHLHERLFGAYMDVCSMITAQLDLMAQDNDPQVQMQRARVARKLAQSVMILSHAVVVAEDQVYDYHPRVEVTE